MTAIWSVARAEGRRGWRSLLLIGLLAGVVGATVIGALALARRTTTAYDRLGEVTGIDDARGMVVRHTDLLDRIVALPQVEERWVGRVGVAKLDGTNSFLGVTSGPEEPSPLARPLVLEGRLPEDDGDPDTAEIVLRDDFLREFDIALGTEVPVRFLTEDDYFRFDTGFLGGEPHGPELTLRVVGTVRLAGGYSTTPPGFGGRDLLEREDAMIGGTYHVRLAGGGRGYDEFVDDVADLSAGRSLPPHATEFEVVDVRDPREAEVAADHTATLLGRALLALALAVGLAGTVAVFQVCARHNSARSDDHRVESALGLTRGQRATARLIAGAGPAVLALVAAAVGAVAASSIQPIGAVKQYEPNPGRALNLAIVGAGVVVTVAVVLAACVLAGALSQRRPALRPLRESRLVERAARLGGGPEGVLGLRFALEPGRGGRTVPVRSAITGTAVGVAGVVAGLVFAASLDRLVDSRVRSGIPFDAMVADVDATDVGPVLDEPLLGGVTMTESAPVRLDGRSAQAHALTDLRGRLEIDLESGRLPRTPDEVVLGLRLARDLDVQVGDTVTAVDGGGDEHVLAVVGTGVVPPLNNEPLGLNALLTPDGLDTSARTEAFSSAAVTVAEGGDPDELVDLLAARFEADAHRVPTEVDNLRQLGALPAMVAALVGLIAVIALVNALVVVVRRRRSDLSLLRAIGCTAGQTARAIVVMALTIAGFGLVLGVPLGMAAGSSLWRLTAAGAFVTTDALVPWAWVVLLAAGAVVVALVAAVVPARRAAALPPAAFLRAE